MIHRLPSTCSVRGRLAFCAVAPSSGPQSLPIDPEMFGTKSPPNIPGRLTSNLSDSSAATAPFFTSPWIPSAVCSVCHTRQLILGLLYRRATGVQRLDVTVCYVFGAVRGLLLSAKHLSFRPRHADMGGCVCASLPQSRNRLGHALAPQHGRLMKALVRKICDQAGSTRSTIDRCIVKAVLEKE
jgi:hypothetical protein